VNVVAPGPTDTSGLLAAHGKGQSPSPADLARNHPRGRIATVGEQVNAIMFLLSDRSSFISGQVIGVNGGTA
jgi:NAD(P)-dependent dehydrogenase (short-subunit alcohol dehydrogenase family)